MTNPSFRKRRTQEMTSDHDDGSPTKKIKFGTVAGAKNQVRCPAVVGQNSAYSFSRDCDVVLPSPLKPTSAPIRIESNRWSSLPPTIGELLLKNEQEQQLERNDQEWKHALPPQAAVDVLVETSPTQTSNGQAMEFLIHKKTTNSEMKQEQRQQQKQSSSFSFEEPNWNASSTRENRKYSIIQSVVVLVLLWSNIIMAVVGLQHRSFQHDGHDSISPFGDGRTESGGQMDDVEYSLSMAKRKALYWKNKATYYRSSMEAMFAGLDHCKSRLRRVEEELVSHQQEQARCADYVERCHIWASEDECDKNPVFMHRQCALSCGVCDG